LSTNLPFVQPLNLEVRINNLLEAPSNYELHNNGKVFIISEGRYLRGRGNVQVELFDVNGVLVNTFNSIRNCAEYFRVSERTINRRLDSGDEFIYNSENFIIKRVN